MDKEVILENEFTTVFFYPTTKIIHHQFHKFTHGEEFRNALMKGTAIFENNRANKWLSDDRKNPVMKQEDMTWTKTEWRPEIIKAGLKYWAIVLPESTVGQMAINKIVKEYKNLGVTLQLFTDPDEALMWLKTK
jgi:hypothetical protein